MVLVHNDKPSTVHRCNSVSVLDWRTGFKFSFHCVSLQLGVDWLIDDTVDGGWGWPRLTCVGANRGIF